MKVGILTFHRAKNYGAVLQAYALQSILKKFGIDAYIIDRYSGHESLSRKIYFSIHPTHIFQKFIWLCFIQFSKTYLLPKTIKYPTNFSLKKFFKNENMDSVIVGSDQVWRIEYSQIGLNYFFDFIEDEKVRRISYAASFGKDCWEENNTTTQLVGQLLNRFHAISVRENSGVKICADTFRLKSTLVLDPTFLLKPEEYDSLLMKKFPKKNNNKLVSYILGINNIESLKYCNKLAKENDLDYSDLYFRYTFYNLFKPPVNGKKHFFHISVPQWLVEIRDAKYVVTNSFHATIFAILFKKQFLVFDNKSGGSDRIQTLLAFAGLQDRFVAHIEDITVMLLNQPIDYNSVHSNIESEKIRSIQFLKDSLFS